MTVDTSFMNSPAYPVCSGAAPDALPPSLRTAVNLMFLGAGLSAVAGIVNASYVQQALARGDAVFGIQASATPGATGTYVAAVIGSALIDVALWLWMAYVNRSGHGWARITGTVFFGLASLGLLALVAPALPISRVFSLANWAIGLGAVVFLWRADSSAYFNRPRGLQYGGYPTYPPAPMPYPGYPPQGQYAPPGQYPPAPAGQYPPAPADQYPPAPAGQYPPAPPGGWTPYNR